MMLNEIMVKPFAVKTNGNNGFNHDILGANVFCEVRLGYINEFRLFYSYFNAIPNWKEDREIDCIKAQKWFGEQYKEAISQTHYSLTYKTRRSGKIVDDFYFILQNGMLVYFETTTSLVRILFKQSELAMCEEIEKELEQFRKKPQKKSPSIFLLVFKSDYLDTQIFAITKPRLRIQDNYNDDFADIHALINKRLSKKNDKGLVLLHGKPGTGKTSYIRYLIASVKKKVIFIPPNMAASITNPDFMGFILDNSNSILVIEDAENILVDRERNGYSPVSALLNVADGLLSDCLNIQIICSFNTDISKVDNALMRKGRLIAKYEFKELETDKAQTLSNKLGYSTNISKPMTLTDIYNQSEMGFEQGRRVGFGFRVDK